MEFLQNVADSELIHWFKFQFEISGLRLPNNYLIKSFKWKICVARAAAN